MIETKNKLKELGKHLRESGATHRDALRSQLLSQMQDQEVKTENTLWKPLVFSGASIFAVIALVLFARPEDPVAYLSQPIPEMAEDQVIGESAGLTGSSSVAEGSPAYFDLIIEHVSQPMLDDSREIVDYEQEHGQMLETSVTINLLTQEEDPLARTESLFTSIGGHISSIYDYGMGQPTTVTGFVPSDSYFLFREQLRDLVKGDRFILETVNAQDLIPSAISIDEYIEEVKAEIEKTTNETKKAQLEAQLENLTESRESLDGRVEFVTVSVTLEEISGFWGVSDQYELERVITGFEAPSFLGRAWLNILIVIFWFIQAFSVTFWLVIPIGIWLMLRRKNRKMLRALD